MSFLAPVWLLGLLPWAAVVGWVLSGQRQRAVVPFLELWRGGEKPLIRSSRAWNRPPLAIVLLLAASLLAILAAARPRIDSVSSGGARWVTVVVDRGITMSARGPKGSARWAELMENIEPLVQQHIPKAVIDYVFVPADESKIVDTRQLILPAIEQALGHGDTIVVAITDRPLEIGDPRLIQICPEAAPQNVGIASAAVGESAQGRGSQVMVRVRNDSPLTRAQLKVDEKAEPIELPPRGQERNYFVDLVHAAAEVSIELTADDDLPFDNKMKLIRRSAWPQIEVQGELSPEILRMIDVYRKQRPPVDSSSPVTITTTMAISPSRAAVIVAGGSRAISASPPGVEAHPISASVQWDSVIRQGVRIASPPAGDWNRIVWAGDDPLVLAREAPTRQVWVGFTSDSFPRSSDFVVFWTNVLDWVGGGGPGFVMQGIPAVAMEEPPKMDIEGQFQRLPAALRQGREISPWMAVGGVLLIFVSGVVWGLQKLRGELGFREIQPTPSQDA